MKGAQGPFRVGRSRTGLGVFAPAVIENGLGIIDDIGPRITNAEVTTGLRLDPCSPSTLARPSVGHDLGPR